MEDVDIRTCPASWGTGWGVLGLIGMTSDWDRLHGIRLDSVLIFLMVSDTEANVSAIVMDTDEEDSEVVLVIDSDDRDLDDLERR